MSGGEEAGSGLAPGVPDDYYERIAAVEGGHWWHSGMRDLTAVLLADALAGKDQALLDAGCGTGGFLRWIAGTGAFSRLVGADLSTRALGLAQEQLPELELRLAPLHELPFADGTFDVVTVNDVLQHVPEDQVTAALRECARVLRSGGTLLIRTNGAWRARRERDDWRIYDRRTLAARLELAGLQPERLTFAAMVPSLWAVARGQAPRTPRSAEDPPDGIPDPTSKLIDRVGRFAIAGERWWLARSLRPIPFGHTLFAVARA